MFTPLSDDRRRRLVSSAMFAFLVWLFAIPETPFSTLPGFNPFYGFVALVLSTLLIPIVEKIFVK